jgi:hypothetical protein
MRKSNAFNLVGWFPIKRFFERALFLTFSGYPGSRSCCELDLLDFVNRDPNIFSKEY